MTFEELSKIPLASKGNVTTSTENIQMFYNYFYDMLLIEIRRLKKDGTLGKPRKIYKHQGRKYTKDTAFIEAMKLVEWKGRKM